MHINHTKYIHFWLVNVLFGDAGVNVFFGNTGVSILFENAGVNALFRSTGVNILFSRAGIKVIFRNKSVKSANKKSNSGQLKLYMRIHVIKIKSPPTKLIKQQQQNSEKNVSKRTALLKKKVQNSIQCSITCVTQLKSSN